MNKRFLLSLTLLGLMVYDPLMVAAPQAKPRSKAARAWAKHRKWVIPTATALGLLAVGGGAYAWSRSHKKRKASVELKGGKLLDLSTVLGKVRLVYNTSSAGGNACDTLQGPDYLNFLSDAGRTFDVDTFFRQSGGVAARDVMQRACFVPVKAFQFAADGITMFIDAQKKCMIFNNTSVDSPVVSLPQKISITSIWGCSIPSGLVNPPGAVSTAGHE